MTIVTLVVTMEMLIFFTSFVQSLNTTSGGMKIDLSSNDSLVNGSGAHSLVNTTIANMSDSNDSYSSGDNIRYFYDKSGVHQSVLMIPLMLPHMRLLLELCLGISAVCLTMHLLVYGFVPKLRNTPGKCLMSLSMSLLCASITFVGSLHIEPSPEDALCVSIAIIRLYSFLAAFFWMNVLAFDVYKTFTRAFKFKISIIKTKSSDNNKFLVYSLYAWLMPALIVILTLILQTNIDFYSPFNPSYGLVTCGISHFAPILIFFFIPVCIILLVNVILFIITARKLKETAEQTRFATKSKAKVTDRLVLYMKLIAILGFTWIFWFVALFTQTPLFTYPTIFLHGLNGAFIFVAFTVKRSVYRLILLRIKYLRGRHKHINTTIRRLNPPIMTTNNYMYSKSDITTNWNDPYRSRFSSLVPV